MAFDPKAFLAEDAPASKGFDPKAFIGDDSKKPVLTIARDAPDRSALGALGEGVVQGATFGFADEIAGATQGKQYQQNARENVAAAREAHPWVSTAGEILGGLATTGAYGLASGARATAAAATARGGTKAAIEEASKATSRYELSQSARVAARTEGNAARALVSETTTEASQARKAAEILSRRAAKKPWFASDAAATVTRESNIAAEAAEKAKEAVAAAKLLRKPAIAAENAASAEVRAAREVAFRPLTTARSISTAAKSAALPSLRTTGAAVAQGALYGAGSSDADTLGGRIEGAAVGGAVGGIASKVIPLVGKGVSVAAQKVIGNAPERVEGRMIRDLVGSTNPSARNKLLGPGGVKMKDVATVMRSEPEIIRTAGRPVEQFEAVKAAAARHEEHVLAPIYKAVDAADPAGIPVAQVEQVKNEFVSKLRKEFSVEAANAIERGADERLAQTTGGRMSAEQMRGLVKSFQSQAFQGTAINPTPAREAAQEFAMGLRNVLNDHIETVAEKNGLNVANVRQANAKMAVLMNLRDVAERNATREVGATKISPFSLENAERLAKSPGAAVAALASGNIVPYAAGRAIGPTLRTADKGLAKLVLWMRSRGGFVPPSDILSKGSALGLPRRTIKRVIDATGHTTAHNAAAGEFAQQAD